jgi:hypothetical protein
MSIKNDFSFFLVKKLNKKEKKIEQKVKKTSAARLELTTCT